MNELNVINQNGKLLLDSREVAELTGKRHADLLRDIEAYKVILDQNADLRSDQFFIESSYEAGTGKSYKCYLLTRIGCDMVANKMTGKKGVLFTAMYVTKFEEMEKQLQAQLGIPSYMIDDTVERAQKWIKEEQVRIELKQKVIEFVPKISYLETILNSKGTVTITQIAKDYGMSGLLLNRILHDEGVQYRVNGQWVLYREHDGNGYVDSITHLLDNENARTFTAMTTRWTQKGRLFIHEILKQRGVVPVMEREQVAN